MSNKLEDERANVIFSVVCYAALFALCIGIIIGGLITYFILTKTLIIG